MSARDRGVEMFEKVYCGALSAPEKGQDDFMDLMIENLFGSIWAREDKMSVRDRRLVIMGIIAAQGSADLFGFQAQSALQNGELTEDEVKETILTATQYVGYPRASACRMAAETAIAQARKNAK